MPFVARGIRVKADCTLAGVISGSEYAIMMNYISLALTLRGENDVNRWRRRAFGVRQVLGL
jgi:hypothetical protein